MSWLKSLAKNKQLKACFCLRQDGIAMVLFDMVSKRALVHEFITLDGQNEKDLQFGLLELVERYELMGHECRLVLTPNQYQLLTSDCLNVPSEELAQAIKWRMKGLLDYPLDDVVMDVFEIPPHGLSAQKKMVFVAACQHSWLQQRMVLFKKALLTVTQVDISDLALRNLIKQQSAPNETVACLFIDSLTSKILICFDGNLYLVRQLSNHFRLNDTQGVEQLLNSIVVEIKRSYDYCHSELKLNTPTKLLVSPRVVWHKKLFEYLTHHLAIPNESNEVTTVVPLNVNQYFDNEQNINLDKQAQILLALGGGLEGESDLDKVEDHAAN